MRLHAQLEAGEEIESPQAYLATVVTRLAIDELRSARARRETYVGEWLPEPIVTDPSSDPAAHAELADSLSLAFLVVLESLTPEQRAVFLLREVFDYPYDRIAGIVGRSEDASRQLAAAPGGASRRTSRASRRRPSSRSGSRAEFFAAVEDGDLSRSSACSRPTSSSTATAAARRRRIARPISGRTRAARTLVAWSKAMRRASAGSRSTARTVNGQPGATMSLPDGRLISVMALEFGDGRGARRALDREPGEARAPRPAGRRAGAGQPASAAALKPASASSISLWRTLSRTAPRASIESIRPGSRPVE